MSYHQGQDKGWAGGAGCLGRNGLLQGWEHPVPVASVTRLSSDSDITANPNPKGSGGGSLSSLPWALDDLVQALITMMYTSPG